MSFSAADREQLAASGISVEEAQRHLELLRRDPDPVDAVRACTRGDGITLVTEGEMPRFEAEFQKALAAGRVLKFTPASGAASRMFKALLTFHRPGESLDQGWLATEHANGNSQAKEAMTCLDGIQRFAFYAAMREKAAAAGDDLDHLVKDAAYGRVLDYLLTAKGLDAAAMPKGLLPFHRYPDGARTAFEEHLAEARDYADDGGTCRLHFTVSPEHHAAFEAHAKEAAARLAGGPRYDVSFSFQKPETDTLAADAFGDPFRDDDGRLVLRPGGHGALIRNLADTRGDIVFIKNIDNVVPDERRAQTVRWKRALGGLLVELQRQALGHLNRLAASSDEESVDEAERFAAVRLSVRLPAGVEGLDARRRWLVAALDRPLRVCGVVPNTGEPGGGPFWVRRADGSESLQIVERSELGSKHAAMLKQATHFNPVDLVCALRGPGGQPYDLRQFIDDKAVFVSHKSLRGKELRALERPGLWNGAMAGWNTVFVEVPLETFNPVKQLSDLLREAHQPAGESVGGKQ